MEEVLTTLAQKNIKWGIVTNKMGFLTDALLAQLHLDKRSICSVSGDTLPRKKPHPDPLFHACDIAQTPPEHCLYVGDAARDVEAGQRAGMRTLVALYGYIGAEDRPETWGATGLLNTPLELLHWV
jgi:phosphoglycolate phosphatase